MPIELLLSVASLALSVGGLVPVFVGEPTRSRAVIAVIFTALLCLASIVLYREYSYERLVSSVMVEIERKLSSSLWTYEQIHESVHLQPPQITREALFRMVANGKVGDKVETFVKNGVEWKVRAYYIR
jgi:hypothetical protein